MIIKIAEFNLNKFHKNNETSTGTLSLSGASESQKYYTQRV